MASIWAASRKLSCNTDPATKEDWSKRTAHEMEAKQFSVARFSWQWWKQCLWWWWSLVVNDLHFGWINCLDIREENWGNMFLPNVGRYLLNGIIPHKTSICTVTAGRIPNIINEFTLTEMFLSSYSSVWNHKDTNYCTVWNCHFVISDNFRICFKRLASQNRL